MEGTVEAGASPAQSDPDALFRKFNDYPWVKDRQFLQGLAAMLGTLVPSADMDRATSICVQARTWWFQSRLCEQVDPAAYAAYLAANPSAPRPDPAVLARIEDIQHRLGMAGAGEGSAVPSWQVHAPKADLAVKALDGAGRGASAAAGRAQDAPYPEHFKAIIEAVTLGKPVPGVREIPSTVVRQPGITPVGKMQPPRKPWEKLQVVASDGSAPGSTASPFDGGSNDKDDSGHTSGALLQDTLDQEFPPVEDEELGSEEKDNENGTLTSG